MESLSGVPNARSSARSRSASSAVPQWWTATLAIGPPPIPGGKLGGEGEADTEAQPEVARRLGGQLQHQVASLAARSTGWVRRRRV